MSLQNDSAETVGTKQNKPKHKKLKKALIIIAIVLLCLLIAALSAYAVMYNIGKKQLLETNRHTDTSNFEEFDDTVVEHNGARYKYNENITSILFMGVDKKSIKTESDDYGTNGQADAVYLMAIDTSTGKTDVIGISRDSMADISLYSKEGRYIGTEKMQLCLAYAYGDRRHSSCQNVVQSVSRMFYGIPINTYFAIDLSGINPLVKAIGGFTVNEYDENNNVVGTKYINSKNAMEYVRTRDNAVLDSNVSRMSNQQEFLKAFAAKVTEQTKQDLMVPVQLYNVVADYAVTNINASKITYLASKYISANTSIAFHTVQGQVVQGEYAEFHIDTDALYDLLLDIYYVKQ